MTWFYPNHELRIFVFEREKQKHRSILLQFYKRFASGKP
jgi:hypothetical protein